MPKMCDHPASALKPSTAEQLHGNVTVRFCCTVCLVPISKTFMLSSPEPLPRVEKEIEDLLALPEPTPDMPVMPAKVNRGESLHPWRR
jgi:hypothetical protein